MSDQEPSRQETHAPEVGSGLVRAPSWMLAAMLVPLVVYIAALVVADPGPGWRAEYFANEELRGEAIVREERDPTVQVRWDPPVGGLGKKHFSVRWQTCLEMEQTGEVALQLTSDDGARLFVDGKLIIDNWGVHPQESRGRRLELSAGRHHLRLEYHQSVGAAVVGLNASFEGEVPVPIPAERLHYPSGGGSDCS